MLARPHFQKLVERARLLPELAAAVVFPLDRDALQLALSGAFAGYLAPTLVGPEQRIRDAANRAGLDISRLPIIDTPDQPRAAAERAVMLAREGRVHTLIRGSLSPEDLLHPVADAATGLRGERRLSHATFLDLPGQSRFLIIADASLNVAPTLAAKKDIVSNTLALANALGLATPHVALLAAKNTVAPAFPSTSEAAALKSMAAQGAFPGAIVDGPLTPDVALSSDAAKIHGVKSEVAGCADVLIAPSMEAATMVLRTLTGVSNGLAAGIVLGAKVPLVIPGLRDPMDVRIASCVLASLLRASGAANDAPLDTARAAA
ncbi:MAG TPA: bifunctional enoyl-CoA hydratase/phosphate acetyltransferase [Casimicrobiaceae bacterium]|nr:bifunctional enoyl-CoA hydratase/phosphate acetyltransferase [Casimicrobiaceae bacterium]